MLFLISLDKFYGHISDFYDERNVSDSKICYLEFAAMEISDFPKHTASSGQRGEQRIKSDVCI